MKANRVLLIALATWATPTFADTGMKIVTEKGYVEFVVADDWPVLSMNTKGPVASAVFQLPNAADIGTPESTNLVLMLYNLGTEQGRRGFDKPVPQYGSAAPEVEQLGSWVVYRQHAVQDSVEYTILDAKRKDVGDRAASVRLAWPHLPTNTSQYDDAMEKAFRQFLEAVKGHIGPYQRKKGEVIRRPNG